MKGAARGLGITRQQLHKVLAGTSAVTPETAVKLEAALGSTAETSLRTEVNYDLSKSTTTCPSQLRPVQSARERRRREREAS